MSLADKQARAEQLRGELSALRSAREAELVNAHDALVEERVDLELETLELQVTEARAQFEAEVGTGSVDDAKDAMEAAAAITDSQAELAPVLPDSDSVDTEVTVAPEATSVTDEPVEMPADKATDSRGTRRGGK